jgi:hypothetical protein
MTGTRVYGASDDLLEFEGDVYGEHGCYAAAEEGFAVDFSDGTILRVRYGKGGVWALHVVIAGRLFDRIDVCEGEDGDPYSDQAFFRPGLEWAEVDGKRVS